MNRDQVALAQEGVQLDAAERRVRVLRHHHLVQHDEQLPAVFFELGSRVDLQTRVDGHGMQIEAFAQQLELGGRWAHDVYPQ